MDNSTGRMMLQTPDFFLLQEQDAAQKIGSHLLLSALFPQGAAIACKFNKMQDDQQQWIDKLGANKLLVGIGEISDVKKMFRAARMHALWLRNCLTADYVTSAALKNFLSATLEQLYQNSTPCGGQFLVVDVSRASLVMLEFTGTWKKRAGFGVIGGMAFMEPTGKLESKAISLGGGQSVQIPVPEKAMKNPAKEAVDFLKALLGDRESFSSREEAVSTVTETILRYDVSSKNEEFEITVFENGKLQSNYVKRTLPTASPSLTSTVPDNAAAENKDGNDPKKTKDPK